MCDDVLAPDYRFTRRRLGALAASATLIAALPRAAHAVAVTESDIVVKTPDGDAQAYLVHPASGKAPAVIMWVDILGLRPVYRQLAKRLAEEGYAVVAPNPYYRVTKLPAFPADLDMASPAGMERRARLRATVVPETQTVDGTAFTAFLEQHAAVDAGKKMGTVGYCMGGAYTIFTAAARPDRIGAVASFHGTRLVTDQPSSPHVVIPKMKAAGLFCIAQDDDKATPNAKDVLRASFAEAKLSAEVEVYSAMHGWCTPGSDAYNAAEAERAWAHMMALFKTALV
jgi:carboxymethylenebutenolidase